MFKHYSVHVAKYMYAQVPIYSTLNVTFASGTQMYHNIYLLENNYIHKLIQ